MMPPTSLQTSTDYYPGLLWLMGELGSARAAEVMVEFERRLGNLIPPEHRGTNSSGSIKWEHYVRWARQHLRDVGLMGSGGRGIWTITESGREWLSAHRDGNKTELLALRGNSSNRVLTSKPSARSFRWRNQTWSVNLDQLLQQARDSLAQTTPSVATRFQSWAVYVDGRPVSVKWLFHLITGTDYNEFDSPTARRLLKQAGFEVRQVTESTTVSSDDRPKVPLQNQIALRDTFLQQVADHLREKLTGEVRHGVVNLFPSKNWIQVNYPEFPGSHYELALRRDSDEVGFHFEARKEENLARLALIQDQVDRFSQILGHQVVAEPWGSRWARLSIDLNQASWNSSQAEVYADLLIQFITETFPLLRQAFSATRAKRGRSPSIATDQDNKEVHLILDRQINQIREYLRGRVARPSEEVLCEWVYFCYTFELFKESVELFNLINSETVDAWPYERAKRIAKVCRIRANVS